MPYNVRVTIFSLIVIVLAVLFFLLFFYRPLKCEIQRKNLAKTFYNAVMRVARNGDYYLINGLKVRLDGNNYLSIDHVLAGDKYIYVITDRYFEGAINVRLNDERWINYRKDDRKLDLINPLFENRFALERLSIASGINSAFMIGIVLINDDCFINQLEAQDEENLLVPISKLERVISTYEAKNVRPFVQRELWQAVQDLHELKLKALEEEKDGK